MLKLIADSGSTKTDWALVSESGEVVASCQSQGLNPYHLGEADILNVLREEVVVALSRNMNADLAELGEVFFYGSGVTDAMKAKLSSLLLEVFPNAVCCAESDMLGAARALYGHEKGIAVILGTGSNSCLYDGKQILEGVPPLGYILGDEGSGTAIGKAFFRLVLRNPMAQPLMVQFSEEYQMEYSDIIEYVYGKPLANRFLASVSSFVGEKLRSLQEGNWNTEEERLALMALQDGMVRVFSDFVEHILSLYINKEEKMGLETSKIPVRFVGSVAYYFEPYIEMAMENSPFGMDKVLKSPMEGLIHYHGK